MKNRKSASKTPRVGVFIETSTSWGRRIISGINQYIRDHESWHLYVEPRGYNEVPVLPQGWEGDGIIARVTNSRQLRSLCRKPVPMVNVSGIHLPGSTVPCVTTNVEAVGVMAADYFMARGFKQFAYLSHLDLEYVARQCGAFVDRLRAQHHSCIVRSISGSPWNPAPNWNRNLRSLGRFLQSLPKPIAILTWSGGHEIIQVCQHLGLRVPEEIAVLSASDDPLFCELSPIPISGVQAACEQIGYQSARMLDQLMHGRKISSRSILLDPLGVQTRRSTDTLAISDSHLVSAIRFIRENLSRPIRVSDLVRASHLSRRVLERRFFATLDCTPLVYIRRLRLEQVLRLLTDTEWPISMIAEKSGFASPEYMTSLFRREYKITPLRYRFAGRSSTE